jgi:hypothetical protein
VILYSSFILPSLDAEMATFVMYARIMKIEWVRFNVYLLIIYQVDHLDGSSMLCLNMSVFCNVP